MSEAVENRIDLTRLKAGVPAAEVCFLAEVDSTNDWALRDLGDESKSKTNADCVLYIAQTQTAGRGRGNHSWESASGCLMLSLVMPCPFQLDDSRRGLIPLAAGCGICAAIEQLNLSLHPQIKWPNDVMLANQKLAGVLVESLASAPNRVVIGCGVNVNNTFRGNSSDDEGLQEQANLNATSINDQLPPAGLLELTSVAIEIVNSIQNYMEILEIHAQRIVKYVQDRDWLLGRRLSWTHGLNVLGPVNGVAAGIVEDGSLLLEVDGKKQKVFTGSILALE